MGGAYVIECRQAGKVYRTLERASGPLGLLASFFHRRVKEHVALRAIDLRVKPGEMLGLIGQNGAGKTTLVKCLTGIVPFSEGSATLLGRDCFQLGHADKRKLSLVMGQRSQLWWDIPAIDSFRLLKEIYAVDRTTFDARVREHAERLGVLDHLDTQLRQLSLGERMKMEIIGAFLHDPSVVFLDEPTIGLDLLSQETIRAFLREINRTRGATIVLTSHDMADIEETCDRLVILDEGAVLFDGDLIDLQRRLVGRRAIEVHLEPGSRGWAPEHAAELERFGATLVGKGPLSLTFDVPASRARAFVQRVFDLFHVHDLSIERQPLEHLIKTIFRSGEIGAERISEDEPARARTAGGSGE
jgi:ABC-2 type transport system ATP-binding protein